jgi:hypothetical protein
MLSGQDKIPYAILFGGNRYMIFTLCPVPGNNLHGLVCSDILDTLNPTIPFMSVVVFCLLKGRTGGIELKPLATYIPAVVVRHPFGRTRLATAKAKNEEEDTVDEALTASLGGLSLFQRGAVSQVSTFGGSKIYIPHLFFRLKACS